MEVYESRVMVLRRCFWLRNRAMINGIQSKSKVNKKSENLPVSLSITHRYPTCPPWAWGIYSENQLKIVVVAVVAVVFFEDICNGKATLFIIPVIVVLW